MKKIFIVASLFLVACATAKIESGSALSQADADRAAQKFPGTTLADLGKGKKLYEENCGTCHKLHAPTSRKEDAWRKVVPPMAKKAKIDEQSHDLVLCYLVTMCVK